jgi:hypothetical protein
MADKKHRIAITMVQTTDDGTDGNTLIEDFSEDSIIHVIKQKVFTKHMTFAANAIAQELCDLALEQLTGGKPPPKKK